MQLNISFNKFKYTCTTILHIKKNKTKTKQTKHTHNNKNPSKTNNSKLCVKQINLNTAYPNQISRQCLYTCTSL